MLVIISDLHLTDGTSGETIREGAFKTFRECLRDLAYDSSWRADGKYKPIEEAHLVLLGDILDVIRSTSWLTQKERPWDGNPGAAAFVSRISSITEKILENNSASLAVLKSLTDPKVVTIPPATRAGKPAKVDRDPKAKGRIPVKVHIHYLVGNHDWFYHLPGPAYNKIRKRIVDALGLAQSEDPFPHDPYESDPILKMYEEHRVFARHGDIYDPLNFEEERNKSSLGDAIVIELLNRFSAEVESTLREDLPEECRKGLKEIDNVRPLLIIPVWVDALLQRACPDPAVSKKVKKIWDSLAEGFLELKFVKAKDSPFNPLDDYDKLQAVLKFSRGVSFATAGRIVQWISEWNPHRQGSYSKYAMKEQAFKSRLARHIVYGHTHHHEVVPLDISAGAQGALTQLYLNSGTWRQVHEMAQQNPEEQEFIGYQVMTYLAFFKDQERGGRTFESWSGTLGE